MMINLTDDQVKEFCHLLHPTPVGKGYMSDWLSTNVPGVSSKQLAAFLLETGRVVRNDGGFPPLVLNSAVTTV